MKSLFIIISTLFLCAFSVEAAEFSADSSVISGERTLSSRFFYAGDRWRLEEHLPKGEYRVTIFREDNRSLYVLWPEKKRYVIQQLPDREFQIISTRKPGKEIERKELGKETISGYNTIKYRVKYDVQGKTMTNIEWSSEHLGVIIKSRAEDDSWSTEIKNIQEGKLNPKLFEVPAEYQQLSDKDIFKGPKSK